MTVNGNESEDNSFDAAEQDAVVGQVVKNGGSGKETKTAHHSVDLKQICKEKRWDEIASRIVSAPSRKDAETKESRRQRVETLLNHIDALRVPVEVVLATVSLCVEECPQLPFRSSLAPWPNNMPVAWNAASGRSMAVSAVGNFLASSWPEPAKYAIIRLLVALYDGSLVIKGGTSPEEGVMDFIFKAEMLATADVQHPTLWELREFCSSRSIAVLGNEEKDQPSVDVPTTQEADRKGSRKTRLCSAEGQDSVPLLQDEHESEEHSDSASDNGRVNRSRKEEVEVRPAVIQGSEFVAAKIADGAKWIEQSLAVSTPKITHGIDSAGDFMKKRVTPREKPVLNNRDRIITKTFTDTAKRATGGVRVTARTAVIGIRGTSVHGIKKLAQQFNEKELGSKIVPDKEHRDVLKAVGTIGLATLGAVAIVSEAIYDTSAAVAKKSVSVTADIVRQRHGEDAGKVVEDAGESMGNVLRTVKDVRILNGGTFTKIVAKDAGKVQIKGDSAEQKETKKMNAQDSDLRRRISSSQLEES